jgi:hypothetical protein
MGSQLVETCDVCGRVVSGVLRDSDGRSPRHDGYGYIRAKRYVWRFGPWPRFWHREDRGWEYVCDACLDAVRAAVGKADAGEEKA